MAGAPRPAHAPGAGRVPLRDCVPTRVKTKETEAPPAGAARWDANCDRATAQRIFDTGDFLQGVHVSSLAEELGRSILVLELAAAGVGQVQMVAKCGGHLTVALYPPGYDVPTLDMKKPAVMAALAAEPVPLVLHLAGGHFSPLLTQSQKDARVFPPRALLALHK